jgi:hypothetical protein
MKSPCPRAPALPPPRPCLAPARTPCTRGAPVVYWPAVGTAAAVAVLLLAGLCAWATTHPRPHKGALPGTVAVNRVVLSGITPDDPRPAQTPTASAPVITAEAAARAPAPAAGPRRPDPVAAFAPRTTPVAAPAPVPAAPPSAPRAETYGTSVTFLDSPAEAARQARRENKLLFVLHIAGNFEESCFT